MTDRATLIVAGMLEAGHSISAIQRQTGLARSTIRRIIKAHDLDPPPRYGAGSTGYQITVYVTRDQWRKLDDEARRRNVTLSALCREILERGTEGQNNVRDNNG